VTEVTEGTETAYPLLSAEVLRALERVEIVTAIGERGSFRLSFRLERGATLPEQFLLDSGALVRVVVSTPAGGARPVVMDGVIVAHTVSGRGHDSTLTIDGEDLTLLMDLDDTVVRTFAGMPVVARVPGARISVAGAEILIDNGHGASIALTGNQVRITGLMV
jgi:hypothetical protein